MWNGRKRGKELVCWLVQFCDDAFSSARFSLSELLLIGKAVEGNSQLLLKGLKNTTLNFSGITEPAVRKA
jgi:hypothetical protein